LEAWNEFEGKGKTLEVFGSEWKPWEVSGRQLGSVEVIGKCESL
jgi:hypothetical protein